MKFDNEPGNGVRRMGRSETEVEEKFVTSCFNAWKGEKRDLRKRIRCSKRKNRTRK